MVVRDRLAELQENAKHIKPSDLEEGEATPLKQKDKKMSASQIDFLEALQELHEDIEQVCKYYFQEFRCFFWQVSNEFFE